MALLAAKEPSAERIIAVSRNPRRQELARFYGPTDGKVFDLTLPLEPAAQSYQAMGQRLAVKLLLTL